MTENVSSALQVLSPRIVTLIEAVVWPGTNVSGSDIGA